MNLSLFIFANQHKSLDAEGTSHRKYHFAVRFQLFYQWRRYNTGCSRYDNCIKRPFFLPAEVTVARLDKYIIVAQLLQSFFGRFGKLLKNFDCINFTRNFGTPCRLICRTGADLKNFRPDADFQILGHISHNVRLAYRLAQTYGEGMVIVSPSQIAAQHKGVSWYRMHRT